MTAVGPLMRTTALTTLMWLFGRNLITRGKVALAAGLSLVCVVLSFAIRRADDIDPDTVTIEFVYAFGLTLMVPVLALVISSSVLGDLVADESLVYLGSDRLAGSLWR